PAAGEGGGFRMSPTTTGTAPEETRRAASARTPAAGAPGPADQLTTAAPPANASARPDAPRSGRLSGALRRLPHLLLHAAAKSAAVLALLVLWETAPRLGLVDRTFLPPFTEVARAWWELAGDGR